MLTVLFFPSLGTPAKIWKKSDFENLDTGEYIPKMEYQIHWQLDTETPCRLVGVPFKTFIGFYNGCNKHT